MLRLGEVAAFVKNFALNGNEPFLFRDDDGRQYRDVLVGVQSADDPFWKKMQGMVPGHLLPHQVMPRSSVISMFFAWDEVTIAEAGKANDVPPLSWYIAKSNFNRMVPFLVDALRDFLPQSVKLIHPEAEDLFKIRAGRPGRVLTNWSEKHVAYACGLGCFGLHGGIITSAGSAGRLVSFIVGDDFQEYAAYPDDPFSYCLLLTKGKCGACIERCPVGAISGRGCDVALCRGYVHTVHEALPETQRYVQKQACNFCMTGVPCAAEKPKHESC